MSKAYNDYITYREKSETGEGRQKRLKGDHDQKVDHIKDLIRFEKKHLQDAKDDAAESEKKLESLYAKLEAMGY